MRAFIKTNLSSHFKDEAKSLINKLRGQISGKIKWQEPEDLHLTLEFLGEINSKEQTKAQKAIRKTAQELSQFSISFEKLKTFSKESQISHIYLSVRSNRLKLCRLQANLSRNLKELGFETEKRKYLPHLTLAQVKKIDKKSNRQIKQFIKQVKIDLPSLTVNELCLTQSLLKPEKACYNKVSSYPLTD